MGGDFVTGPSTVIQAIAAGRRGAIAIDKHLRSDPTRVDIPDERLEVVFRIARGPTPVLQSVVEVREGIPEAEPKADRDEAMEMKPRSPVPALSPEERITGFEEIELGYTEEQAGKKPGAASVIRK